MQTNMCVHLLCDIAIQWKEALRRLKCEKILLFFFDNAEPTHKNVHRNSQWSFQFCIFESHLKSLEKYYPKATSCVHHTHQRYGVIGSSTALKLNSLRVENAKERLNRPREEEGKNAIKKLKLLSFLSFRASVDGDRVCWMGAGCVVSRCEVKEENTTKTTSKSSTATSTTLKISNYKQCEAELKSSWGCWIMRSRMAPLQLNNTGN